MITEQHEADLRQIDISIELAREAVDLKECYKRLTENKDFKTLIEEYYFKTFACRLVMLRGDSNINDDLQEKILKEIDSIALFRSFLRDIVRNGNNSEIAIADAQEQRAEILAGPVSE